MDHVTQQNAAMFEETTAASHALTQEANALVAAVERFSLDRTSIAKTPHAAQSNQVTPSNEKTIALEGNTVRKVEKDADLDRGWEEF